MEMTMETRAATLPRQNMFLMGNGKPVRPSDAGRFSRALVDGCLDAEVIGHYEFFLGFAACFDAIARGTADLNDPIGCAMQALEDVHNVSPQPNKVTDIMRIGD